MREVVLHRSAGWTALDLRLVRVGWATRFHPAVRDGRGVPAWVELDYRVTAQCPDRTASERWRLPTSHPCRI